MRSPEQWIPRAALLLFAASVCLAAGLTDARADDVYLWYEVEALFSGENWITHRLWEPSGGLFLYTPADAAAPAEAAVTLPAEDRWVVWLRCRDETRGLRQMQAEIDGRQSYVMGGTDAGQWVWYAVGVVHGDRLAMSLRDVAPMDAWADALLVCNDPGFVPPPVVPSPDGYTAYDPDEDTSRGHRPAWIWWPRHPRPGSLGSYRKVFELSALPKEAELSVIAMGACKVWLNGRLLGDEMRLLDERTWSVSKHLRRGRNVIAVQVMHVGFLPGLRAHLKMADAGGQRTDVVSDMTWSASERPDAEWIHPDYQDRRRHRPWARIGERDVPGFSDQTPPAID